MTAADGPGVYLAKDSDDLVSHCACDRPLVSYPGQADCPWCNRSYWLANERPDRR